LKLIYLMLLAVTVCLLMLPSLPFTEWVYFSLLFFILVISIGLLSFNVKRFWISFPLSFVLALGITYLINQSTSIGIPYSLVIIMGLLNLAVGIYTLNKRRVGKHRDGSDASS
jgi:hypothetical protein